MNIDFTHLDQRIENVQKSGHHQSDKDVILTVLNELREDMDRWGVAPVGETWIATILECYIKCGFPANNLRAMIEVIEGKDA